MFVFVSISSFVVAMVAASCGPNPCRNGGTCIRAWYEKDTVPFSCKCAPGWDGQICTTPFRYIGCYADSEDRIMPVFLPRSSSNSPLECAARCNRYAFSGTQYGKECYCGNSLNAKLKPDFECNMACTGDSQQKCGGRYRMSVYSNRAAGIYDVVYMH